MEKVAVGELRALNCLGGATRTDGSSQGSAIITTGRGSWLVCGAAGSADEMLGPALMTRIRHRMTPAGVLAALFRMLMCLSRMRPVDSRGSTVAVVPVLQQIQTSAACYRPAG